MFEEIKEDIREEVTFVFGFNKISWTHSTKGFLLAFQNVNVYLRNENG